MERQSDPEIDDSRDEARICGDPFASTNIAGKPRLLNRIAGSTSGQRMRMVMRCS
jgi:hypothetical protein